MAEKTELPQCPFCETTLLPERLTAQRYMCPCCSRVWKDAPPSPQPTKLHERWQVGPD